MVDPFAGGGSIPLEALRVGADAFASDLNPVAVLLNKVVLEYIPKYGQKLADEVRKWGAVDQGAGREGTGRVLPEGPRRRDADRVPVGADDPLRRARLRGGSAADALAVAGEEGTTSVALQLVPNAQSQRVDFEIVRSARSWVTRMIPTPRQRSEAKGRSNAAPRPALSAGSRRR